MQLTVLPALLLSIAMLTSIGSGARGERLGGSRPRPLASAGLGSTDAARAVAAPPGARPAAASFDPGVVLLAFQPGVQSRRQHTIERAVGGFSARPIGPQLRRVRNGTRPLLDPIELRVPAYRVSATVSRLRRFRSVAYAQPDYVMQASAVPNDAFFPLQWADANSGQAIPTLEPGGEIGPPENGTPGADERTALAWRITTGSASIVIGEVDTGVDYEHPDLAANIWSNPGGVGGCPAGTHGYNVLAEHVLPSACEPIDEDSAFGGHGTHVAGIMGAVGDNGAGVAGINWVTSILPVKWLDSPGGGDTANLVEALRWLVAAKQAGVNVRVVNDAATFFGTEEPPMLAEAITQLGENNILFVTAAGNTGEDDDDVARFPCDLRLANEICVTASDTNDQLPTWANYGEHTVDLAAPGVSIYSTLRQDMYGYRSGGSMASPQVAGAAALILSLEPSLSSEELKADIVEHVDPLPALAGRVISGGRLDICRALPGCSRPTVNTTTASSITTGAATLNGVVNADGVLVSDCHFEFGTSESYGASVPCATPPGSGTTPVAVSATVNELSPSTTYHFRAVATNTSGTAYGEDQALVTLSAQPTTGVATTQIAPAGALGSPAAPPPLQKPLPDAELASRALFARSSGTVSVTVSCPSLESECKGTVILQQHIPAGSPASGGRSTPRKTLLLTLAAGSFTVAGGHTVILRLHLSSRARSLLAHAHLLHAKATIRAHDAVGGTHVATTSVTLRALDVTPARDRHTD
jgi:thermitase